MQRYTVMWCYTQNKLIFRIVAANSFSVRYTDNTDANFIPGEYNAYIKTENQLTEFKLNLFSKQNYEEAVGLLNGFADTDNYDEFKRLLEENVRLLDIMTSYTAKFRHPRC